jgi:hypothetical protein
MGRINYLILATQHKVFVTQLEKDYKVPRPQFVETLIAQFRTDMDLLLDTWSIMAARNILTSMERNLIHAESQLSGDSKQAALMLKKHVTRLLEVHTLTKARYDSVLLCGYKVKTTSGRYLGYPDDYTDMQIKADAMIQAIRSAFSGVDAKHAGNDRMLKIFMAPEFFFRGENGAYDAEDVAGMKERKSGGGVSAVAPKDSLISLIRAEIDKPQYKDWLFVLGTVIVVTRSVRTVCKRPGCTGKISFVKVDATHTKAVCSASTATDPHDTDEVTVGGAVDNVALICKEKFVHTISKELISDQDFIAETNIDPKTGDAVPNSDWVNSRGDWLRVMQPSSKPTAFQDERMGGAIFQMDGITFGCEICLDHKASNAKHTSGRLESASGIQIQLIPSAGMAVAQFRTVENGVVFNVDGSTPHVQAVGQTGPDSIMLFESAPSTIKGAPVLEQQRQAKDWNPTQMAAALDLYSNAQMSTDWKPSTAKAPGIAPNGSILQYGPFEIPKP